MTFNIYTLGCKVNTYESNVMSQLLKKNQFIEKNIDEKVDISIVNTCTVTNTANSKSIKTIKHAIKTSPEGIVIVVGCMSQISPEIVREIPGVDIVLGNNEKIKLIGYINEFSKTKKQLSYITDRELFHFEDMEVEKFNRTRGFVKIQDGCNNYCTFCIIPYARGGVRSKEKEKVLREIGTLVNSHSEIVLTGIHTGHYGSDLDNYNFSDLLTDILKIPKLKRLRISSIEMNEITDELLDLLKNNKVLVNHMHIPLQSGSEEILKKMNRKYSKKEFLEKINTIKSIRPEMSITTDIIVGFPGEEEKHHEETLDFVKKIEFTKIHVFPYSKRNGTPAATFKNQVDSKIKKNRVKELIELSENLEKKYMNKYLGLEVEVLIESEKNEYYIGHTDNYLLVKTQETCEIGSFKKVTIKSIEYPYCIG